MTQNVCETYQPLNAFRIHPYRVHTPSDCRSPAMMQNDWQPPAPPLQRMLGRVDAEWDDEGNPKP